MIVSSDIIKVLAFLWLTSGQYIGPVWALEFLVIGDWGRQGSEGQKSVARHMNRLAASRRIDFIVSTGDNFYENGVNSVDDPAWQSSYEAIYSLPALRNIPWYISLGNHDYRGKISAQIDYGKSHRGWNLPATYYSKEFDIDEKTAVRILFLDTSPFVDDYRNNPFLYPHIIEQDVPSQVSWIKRTLEEPGVSWRIVVGHHPVYSAGVHGDTPELKKILPHLFEKLQVQAYFAGHDHHLEHRKPAGITDYFISGGGSRTRPVGKHTSNVFAAQSLGFAHVMLDASCIRVRFINGKGDVLYQTGRTRQKRRGCPRK